MSDSLGRVLTAQRGCVAVWQMRRMRIERAQIDVVRRQLRRVHRGVYAKGDLDELGWLHAAVRSSRPIAWASASTGLSYPWRWRRCSGASRAARGATRAAFVLLCHDRGLKLPLVNHRLNGCETDFHWRRARLVAEALLAAAPSLCP